MLEGQVASLADSLKNSVRQNHCNNQASAQEAMELRTRIDQLENGLANQE